MVTETIINKDAEGKLMIQEFEILQFLDKNQQGAQGKVAFASNHKIGGRLETIKFYGVSSVKDHGDHISLYCSHGDRHYWEEVRERGTEILARIGQNEVPKFPDVHDKGEIDGILYLVMSCGRGSKEEHRAFSIEDYHGGNLLTLQQVISRSAYGDLETRQNQGRRIDKINSAPYKQKTEIIIDLLKSINILHKNYGIVHNDLKPAQVLLLFSGDDLLVQTIDMDMYVDINTGVYSEYVTTPAYNHPSMLRAALKNNGYKAGFVERDSWSLVLIAQEFILGTHPYKQQANTRFAEKFRAGIEMEKARYESLLESIYEYAGKKNAKNFTTLSSIDNVSRRLEERLHAGLTEGHYKNIDELIEDILPFSSNPGKKITRRRAIQKIGLIIGGVTIAGYTGLSFISNLNSAKYAYNEYLESIKEGKEDITALKNFQERLIKERCIPVIERFIKSPQYPPSHTSNGRYQKAEINDLVTSGDYLRIMLHCGLILANEEMINHFVKMVSNIKVSHDEAYRIIKITDPFEDFLKNKDRINASEKVVKGIKDKLESIHEYIAQNRLEIGDGYSFLIANPKNKPENGYRHFIRMMSYYLIKHFDKHNRGIHDRHIMTMKDILLADAPEGRLLTYDMASFNNSRELSPGIDFPIDAYNNLSQRFYCFGPSQAMMFDLLCDHANLGNIDSKDKAKTLLLTYKQSMSDKGPYDMESPNFMFAPPGIRSVNNFPLTIFAYRTIKEPYFSNKEKRDIFQGFLRRIDVEDQDNEGIMPNSRLRAKDTLTSIPTSDLYALLTINEYIKLKEKSETLT